jgi:CRISPR/Cas system-associated exonuclease Cas4 (RecB family)
VAKINHISATKLSVYQSCPFKYYLNYITKEKPAISPQLAFGKEIHYMVEMFYKRNYKSRESFVNSFKYRWRLQCSGELLKGKQLDNAEFKIYPYELANGDVVQVTLASHIKWYLKKPHLEYFSMKKLGERILGEFYDRHVNDEKPIGLEKRFRFNWRGYPLLGVIDRIDKTKDGKNIVLDYKTDKHPPEGKAHVLNNNPQFTIYSIAFDELYGEPLDDLLYYHLRSGKVYKTERYEADSEYLEQLCKEFTHAVTNDIFTPKYGYNCSFCDYKEACSMYKYGKDGPIRISDVPLVNDVEEYDYMEALA